MLLSSGESDLRRWQRVAQALARAVQAQPDGGAIRAERDRELFSRQALPGDEREQLAVGLAQGREGAGELARRLSGTASSAARSTFAASRSPSALRRRSPRR